jgi:hypothetical protein
MSRAEIERRLPILEGKKVVVAFWDDHREWRGVMYGKLAGYLLTRSGNGGRISIVDSNKIRHDLTIGSIITIGTPSISDGFAL